MKDAKQVFKWNDNLMTADKWKWNPEGNENIHNNKKETKHGDDMIQHANVWLVFFLNLFYDLNSANTHSSLSHTQKKVSHGVCTDNMVRMRRSPQLVAVIYGRRPCFSHLMERAGARRPRSDARKSAQNVDETPERCRKSARPLQFIKKWVTRAPHE